MARSTSVNKLFYHVMTNLEVFTGRLWMSKVKMTSMLFSIMGYFQSKLRKHCMAVSGLFTRVSK